MKDLHMFSVRIMYFTIEYKSMFSIDGLHSPDEKKKLGFRRKELGFNWSKFS